MLKKDSTPTASIPFVRSAGQPNGELRWLGYATFAFATLAVSFLAPATVSAQQVESTHPPGDRVAVIDLDYIFKHLPAIKALESKIQGDLKKYEAERKRKRDALKQSVDQLKTLEVGTVEYARQEEHVAKLESKFRVRRVHRHYGWSDAEAKIYFDNYQRIASAVKAIARRNDIQLVLRFDSKVMDLEHPDSVARGVMKDVIYHDSTINITDTVMRYLEQQTKTSNDATGASAASAIP